MKMITKQISELSGLALNWAFGVSMGLSPEIVSRSSRIYWRDGNEIVHSSDTWNPERDDAAVKDVFEKQFPDTEFPGAEAAARQLAINELGETMLVPESILISAEEAKKPTDPPEI